MNQSPSATAVIASLPSPRWPLANRTPADINVALIAALTRTIQPLARGNARRLFVNNERRIWFMPSAVVEAPVRTLEVIKAEYGAAVEHAYTFRFGSPEEKAYRREVVGPLWCEMNRAIGPIKPDYPRSVEEYEAMEFPLEYRARKVGDPTALFKARYA